MEFKSNNLNYEVTQIYNLLVDVGLDILAEEIETAFLSKDAYKLVNALNYVQQELMNAGAPHNVYSEVRKLYLKCKNMLSDPNKVTESKTVKESQLDRIIAESVKRSIDKILG